MVRTLTPLVLLALIAFGECGVLKNESESSSVSSSVSKSTAVLSNKKMVKEETLRGGKVLYAAPYSKVSVASRAEKSLLPSSPQKYKSYGGPVLLKKDSTVTKTTTSTTSTAAPSIMDLVIVTEKEPEFEESEPSTTNASLDS